MSHRSVLRRTCLPAAVLLAAGLIGTTAARAATGSPAPGAGTASAGAADCTPVTSPTARVDLTRADNGRTVCVVRGQTISVTLSVDPVANPDRSTWWVPIRSTGTALTPMQVPIVPPAGTTLGVFRADAVGTAGVWSDRVPACASRICPQYLLDYWQVTVRVVG